MVYSIGDLKEVIGLSKWTVYEQIKKGEFPRPVQLAQTASAGGILMCFGRRYLHGRAESPMMICGSR